MSIWFFKPRGSKDKHTNIIALDIGTEVAKGLLFDVTIDGVVVKAAYYLRQPLQAMQAGRVTDLDLVESTVTLVLEGLFKQINAVREPNMPVVLGIAGELINGISIQASLDRIKDHDSPIGVDEERMLLSSLFDEIIAIGKKDISEKVGVIPDELIVLNITLAGGYVDGRRFRSLRGATGRYITANLYASFAPMEVVSKLTDLTRRLSLNLKGIVVQPYAVAGAVGDSKPDFSGIIIDIGGGTTDVAVVRDGIEIQTQMVAFGGRAFTSRIAKSLGVGYNIAEEQKIKYSAGMLGQDIATKIREVIQEDVRLWLDTVRTALSKVDIAELPSTIYLCGGGALLPDIQDGILAYPWQKFLNFVRHPTLQLITVSKLPRVYDKTGRLTYPYDVTPASIAKFAYDLYNRPLYNYVGF